MKRIILFVLSVFITASLFACGGGSKDQATSGSNKSAASKSNASATTSNASASKAEEASGLIGTWAYSDSGVVMDTATYTFNADMTGKYTLIGDFTYTDDGSKIVFTYTGSKVYTEPLTFAYRIEGDKLILTDDAKQETVYVKQ